MRKAEILYKDRPAGILTQHDDGSFTFQYYNHWTEDVNAPAISLTFPKSDKPYKAEFLFPFFYNMLPEGSNKQIVCRYNKIDRDDYFGILMTTAKNDSIGAVRVIKIE